MTHAGFLRTPYWHRADTWHLFVDEPMEIIYRRVLRLKEHRHLILDFFRVRPSHHKGYGRLEARNDSELDVALATVKDDEIYDHFADLIWRLRQGDWDLYVEHAEYERFRSGEAHTLEVHGLLSPSIFCSFASVTLMGANLDASIMYKYFAKRGCTFSPHRAIRNGLRYQTHANGCRLLIKYLTDRKWSKTLRNSASRRSGDPEANEDIGDAYIALCHKEAAQHSKLPPLWIGNLDIKDDEFDGLRLKNVPHGMNSFMTHDVCCVLSALNPPQSHRKFLQEMCGMTEREVRRALLSQTAYQACGRGILRDPDSTGVFLLIVPDRDTAEDIAKYYPGCQIEKLASDIEEPRRGRPSKYGSDAERDAAKREQNRASQRRVRKKALYSGISSDIHSTPDQVRQSLVHVLNEWAELAPETSGMSGFSRSLWLSKSDKVGQGHTMFMPTGDLVGEFKRRQGITRICKEACLLMCPTIFAEPLKLPAFLTAIGCTIDAPARTNDNALACRGLLLDIENGDMLPDDFASVFPGLEFLAYSSWSHSPAAPRFRIAIPTTQFVPPAMHTLLLHAIVDRLEEAGWGDALVEGRKHGVDIGKLHEAAMFYLPSERPDCFLVHHREGRKPLDPREWVSVIRDDLLASPPPPPPPEAYHDEVAPVHKDARVQWAIQYWRRRGCFKGKGRTQFWLLAKRLAEAGCDEQEMQGILWDEAVSATNRDERRGEIDRLLRDHNVIAARRAA